MMLQLSSAVRGVPQRFVGRHSVGPVVGSAEFHFRMVPCRGMCNFCVPTESSEFPENDVLYCAHCGCRISRTKAMDASYTVCTADNTLSWALLAHLENASQINCTNRVKARSK
jgi:hypothetical protein